MSRYGVGVGFDFEADDDEHAQEISNEVQALIGSHYAVFRHSVNQIEAWPECQEDCPEDEEYDDEFEEG